MSPNLANCDAALSSGLAFSSARAFSPKAINTRNANHLLLLIMMMNLMIGLFFSPKVEGIFLRKGRKKERGSAVNPCGQVKPQFDFRNVHVCFLPRAGPCLRPKFVSKVSARIIPHLGRLAPRAGQLVPALLSLRSVALQWQRRQKKTRFTRRFGGEGMPCSVNEDLMRT